MTAEHTVKRKGIGLLPKIIIAIILGIICGMFFPEWLVRSFMVINAIFGNFLSFIIPLLIVGLIAPGIADLGSRAGKLLILTILIAYFSTLCFGFITYFICGALYPFLLTPGAMSGAADAGSGLTAYFTIPMPPVLDVTSALVLAFVLGFGLSAIKGIKLKEVVEDFREIINKVITAVIIPLLPLYIFTIFLNITTNGNISHILSVFIKIIVLIFALTILLLIAEFVIAGLIAKKNPFTLIKNMLPAYATALGTSSSAATIPVTYAQVLKNNVHPELAGFVVPLCATIHMPGSITKIVACSLAIIMSTGMDISVFQFAGFICMLGIAMVAAPGVPGGAIMAALGVLSSMLGFNETTQALMIALYIVMDSFGTATNVTCDGAIASIINRIYDMNSKTPEKAA